MYKWFKAFAVILLMMFTASTTAKAEDWTGFYIGGQLTYVPDFGVDWVNPGTPKQTLGEGLMGGMNVGADYQWNNLVFGAIADVNFGNLSDNVPDGNYIREWGQVDMSGTLRARLGITSLDNRFLVYGTGGLAWANMEQGQSCPSPAAAPFGWCSRNGPYSLEANNTLWGHTYGGGVEVQLGQIGIEKQTTLFVEALHTEYGKKNFRMSPDANGNTLPDQIVDASSTTVMFGLRIHF